VETVPDSFKFEQYYATPWRKDGQGFYFLSDEGRDFLALGYCDRITGNREAIVTADWDVEGVTLSADGSLLAYTLNEAGKSTLHVLQTATGKGLPLPPVPAGVIGGVRFAPRDDRRRLFLYMSTYAHAYAVYVLDLEQMSLLLLTPSMLGHIPASEPRHRRPGAQYPGQHRFRQRLAKTHLPGLGRGRTEGYRGVRRVPPAGGLGQPRAPGGLGRELRRLRSLGRDVEYLVFADEGHGFAKRANQLKGYRAMADYLIGHLLP